MLSEKGRQLLQKELQPSERLIWEGQPDPSKIFTVSDIFLIPFSIFWVNNLLQSIGHISELAIPTQFPFVFIPYFFLAVGVYLLVGRFIHKYFLKKNTYYAVTDQRVVIVADFLGRQIQTAFLKDIPTIEKSINAKGVGTLVFANKPVSSHTASFYILGNSYGGNIVAFYDLPEAEMVYRKITDLKEKQSSSQFN
jgi:hypothetical protein